MDIQIKEVKTKKDLKKFIKFEIQLHKKYDNFLPPIISGELQVLSSRNPSQKYCDNKLFLAFRGDEIVGRVAAIINHRSNDRWNCKKVRFGWFDFIEDIEVCKALIHQVEIFGKENGMTEIHGPMGFTDFDKECWIIEGFDQRQNITTLFNPSYYIDYINQLGYEIICKWKQYEFPASQNIPDKVLKINELIKDKYKLKLPTFSSIKQIVKPYGKKFFVCLNDTFSHLYGFVALDEEEVNWYIKNYFKLFSPELICLILDQNDEILGFGISFPSLNEGLKKANGKLFPFGWIHILKALKKYDTIDLMLNGVRPEWQSKGIHSLYYVHMNQVYIEKNIKFAYSNPQIVDNNAVKVWDRYEGKEIIQRAIFQKKLSS